MPKMPEEGTMGHHRWDIIDMTMVPRRLFSKYIGNLKTWLLNKNDYLTIIFNGQQLLLNRKDVHA